MPLASERSDIANVEMDTRGNMLKDVRGIDGSVWCRYGRITRLRL
jgi:hypothetical protein